MSDLMVRDVGPGFGTEIEAFELTMLDDEQVAAQLLDLFDTRGLLVFRDVELTYSQQAHLCEFLIRRPADSTGIPVADNWYISNRRPQSAAPYGRLQFHMDTAWAHQPNEIVSLYAVDLEPPVAPTTFASTVRGYATLPDHLRAKIGGKEAIHSAGEIRRGGDVSDVLVSAVERPPSTRKPVVLTHPRTGAPMLYVGEQNTREIVGMDPDESEALLDELFAHLYDPANQWNHEWRLHDLAAWDNLAIQHARPNVPVDGPTRTLRKVATPMPPLEQDEMPSYSTAS
jgi:alpha-ketoglutarate-dependent taurine dioxygenase